MLPTKNGQSTASPGTIESSRRRLGAIFTNISLFASPSKTAPKVVQDLDDNATAPKSVIGSEPKGNVMNVESGLIRRSAFLALPDELIVHILGFLPAHHTSFQTLGLINRRLRSITESSQLWAQALSLSAGVALDWEKLRERGVTAVRPGSWSRDGKWSPINELAETDRIHYPTLYRSRRLLDRVVRGPSTRCAPLLNVAEHADSVYCLAVAHPWLVTGGRDRSLQVRQLSIGRTRIVANVEKAHEGSVLSCVLEMEGEGGIMVTGSSDSTAAVWRFTPVDTGTATRTEFLIVREQTLRGHADTVLDVALARDQIISCSKDNTIRIYSRADYSLLHNITSAHTGPVNCLSVLSDSSRFVSASGDGSWIMFELPTARELLKVVTTGTDGSSTGHGLACIASQGPYIVTGCNDRDIRIYNTAGTLQRRLEGHTGTVRAIDLDVDEQGRGAIVSGSYDHTVTIWDIETGRIRQRFPNAHESIVLDVQLKNGRLISASHDRTVRVMTFGADLPYRELLF